MATHHYCNKQHREKESHTIFSDICWCVVVSLFIVCDCFFHPSWNNFDNYIFTALPMGTPSLSYKLNTRASALTGSISHGEKMQSFT
ncbi:Os04g0513200 [Oryza sativa Japonica Group]|uniref:Os04g0513200 protein n=1 Tax=Oryza sativa subsp. japonica TaxID=39947 RepID=A0A0N7KJC8_ORYSJ|nr:hypothetical protein EE612_024376 [Oryza sativa]BAS90057.1 Os04g0513200 [Oryza sativa Japonica Group]